MKKLFMIFLIMNFTALFNPQMGMCESIQEIIDNSNPDSTNQNESISKNTNDNLFAIQIGTFFNESDANEQVIKLKSKGLEPYIFQSVNSKGTNVYAARIGKYDSYSDASLVISQLEDQLNIPLIITHFDSLKPASSTIINKSSDSKSSPVVKPEERASDLTEDEPIFTGDVSSLNALMKKINDMEIEIQNLKGESEIRSQLEITEEEAKAEEEDILEAAGREYTLTEQGTIKLSYGISYSYSAYDAIRESTRVEDVADHTISNRLSVSYGLKNNLTVGLGISPSLLSLRNNFYKNHLDRNHSASARGLQP